MRRSKNRTSIALREMKRFQTLDFEPKMIELNPNGHSIVEGWDGFIDPTDGCARGKVPRHIFPDHVNDAIDRMNWSVERLARNTAHTISMSTRVKAGTMPQRSACYGTHQLLTAFGGMKALEYREGYVLKSSPLQTPHPLSKKDKDGNLIQYECIDPSTGIMSPRKWIVEGEERRDIQIIYHGWCWDNDRQETVDITEGTYGGNSDGYIVPLAWQTVGNNAKHSKLTISSAYRKDWARQQKIFKSSLKSARKLASKQMKNGMSGTFEWKVPDAILSSLMWEAPLDIAYSRRAFYHSINDVIRGFTVNECMANGISENSAKAIVSDPIYRGSYVAMLVGNLWSEGSHMRLTAEKDWNSRKKNWREVCDCNWDQDVYDAIQKLRSKQGDEAA